MPAGRSSCAPAATYGPAEALIGAGYVAGAAAAGAERARALKRFKIKRDFGWHLAAYVILKGFLTLIWSLGGGWFWPVWMIVPWGIGLAFHAACTFLGGAVTERDIQREMGTRDRRA